ncbi:MAG: DNA recombination protein RmuC [Pseudomonadota bacterium]
MTPAWSPELWVAVGAGFLFGVLCAAVVAVIMAQRVQGDSVREIAGLEAALRAERQIAEERERSFMEAREQLEARFSLLSDQALDRSSRRFLRLAEARMRAAQTEASADLDARRGEVEQLVTPIRKALERTEAQVRELEQERKQAFGALEKHLELMAEDHRRLRGETRNLVQALRRPEVRGQWGELTLRRLVELVGMVPHCDFSEQVHRQGEQGALRPDLVVHLPDDRDVVVDVKTPLDGYLTAQEAPDDAAREAALDAHARNVRGRVRELAAKAYWEQFERAPDFVVLFVPGEQFLAAALDRDPQLLEDALRQRVILASPTSFVALMRAVAFSWRQLRMIRNAEEIRGLAELLQRRLATFLEHHGRLGKSLQGAVEQFNRTVGSLNRHVLPATAKLADYGAESGRETPSPETIEGRTRDV